MLRSLGRLHRLQNIAVHGRNSVMRNLPAVTSVQFFSGKKLAEESSESLSKRIGSLIPKAKPPAELISRENNSAELSTVTIVQKQQWWVKLRLCFCSFNGNCCAGKKSLMKKLEGHIGLLEYFDRCATWRVQFYEISCAGGARLLTRSQLQTRKSQKHGCRFVDVLGLS